MDRNTKIFEKLIGGTDLENLFDLNVHIFEAFCLTLVKKNCENGERRKKSGGFLWKKIEPRLAIKKTNEKASLVQNL